ncbi:ketopantoate reductase PanE/ApbA C terminal-domain-containing protein [Pyrenochaeta sp. MPI-SDFR-AT-0127]|nr:ketopantoate reductase PanE/ApbA C terminal-domain-containing protein [Pyrenochaeta sp. MPI-SDFR-AT-0127]
MAGWKNERTVQTEEGGEKSADAVDEPAIPKISSNAADFYRAKPVLDRRIHIMGVGNVGCFVAHALRGIPNAPPVTLIFSRWDKLHKWNESSQRLTLVTDGDSEIRDGYDAEVAFPRIRFHGKEVGLNNTTQEETEGSSGAQQQASQPLSGESSEPISSLIICSKAPYVLQGLSAVKHRLNKDSVVLFMLNGMGTVEEVNREIFPDPATRPHYMLGINSHGMHHTPGDPFTTVHAGFGTISLGILPHERDRAKEAPYAPVMKFKANPADAPVYPEPPEELDPEYPPPATTNVPWTPNQRYLLRTLLRTPVLSAAAFSPPDLLQMQLEKLAVNCVVNPLTVMLDGRNGSILYNYALTRTLRLLLAEISLVIRSLPELQYIPNVSQRFDPGRLESKVVSVAQQTKDNISSTLADVRAGKQTEIDYINGWIVKRGEELGIRCLCNYMMVNLVKGKANFIKLETGDGVPFVEGNRQGDLDIMGKQAVSEQYDEGEKL